MQTRRVLVRASIGVLMGALVSPTLGQTGVRMGQRGGVRIGSPSAGAMSKNQSYKRNSTSFGRNSFTYGSYGGTYGRQPKAIYGGRYYGDSIHIDSRLSDDVVLHYGDQTGFHARGSFGDDDYTVQFHLGGALHDQYAYRNLHYYPRRYGHHRVFRNYYGLPYYGSGYYNDPVYAIGYQSPFVTQPPPPPPPPPAAVTEPQSPFEVGIGHLWRGEFQDAIGVLHGVVADNDAQVEAQRLLALALIAEGRVADGVAMMRAAYDSDPALAREPIESTVLGRQAEKVLSGLVRKVSLHANRVDSASGWLTIAALMQAQGRPERAGMMLGRAIDAGLDRNQAEAFGVSLPAAK